MKNKIYRLRKSETAKWLLSLPIHLTHIAMSNVEAVTVKEHIFEALSKLNTIDIDDAELDDPIIIEGDPDAA